MKILAVIPCRKNSSRVPGKNTMMIAGKPCLRWTLEHVAACSYQPDVVVVSDDPEAQVITEAGGALWLEEPVHLAREFDLFKVLEFVVGETDGEYDCVLLAYANTPIRPSRIFDRMIEHLVATRAQMVNVLTQPQDHPYRMRHSDHRSRIHNFCLGNMRIPSQEFPVVYMETAVGWVYRTTALQQIFADRTSLDGMEHRGIICGYDEVVEIDDQRDVDWAEFLLHRRQTNVDLC